MMSLSLYLSVWPSHAVRCARMASTRSKAVVEGLASSACVRLVMVARHFAHQPLIFLRVAAVRFQDSEPYLATVHIHTLNRRSFSEVLNIVDLNMQYISLNLTRARLSRVWTSKSVEALASCWVPKYLKVETFFICVPLMHALGIALARSALFFRMASGFADVGVWLLGGLQDEHAWWWATPLLLLHAWLQFTQRRWWLAWLSSLKIACGFFSQYKATAWFLLASGLWSTLAAGSQLGVHLSPGAVLWQWSEESLRPIHLT